MRLVEQELWEQTLVEFGASLERHPSRSAYYNRAVCLHRMQRLVEAMGAYRAFLERYRDSVGAEERAQIEATIDEIRSLLTEVRIVVSRPGARIAVDDRVLGRSPLEEPALLPSGAHRVVVELEGYHRQVRDITVVSGQPLELRFRLLPVARIATLHVISETANASLEIDGHEVGVLPFRGEVDEGRHDLTITAPGYRPATLEVELTAGEERLETVALRRLAGRAVFWSLLGLTSASLVTTIGLGAAVLERNAEYHAGADDACICLAEGQRLAVATDVMLGSTLVIGIATLVLAFFTDWRRGDLREGADDEAAGAAFDLALGVDPASRGRP